MARRVSVQELEREEKELEEEFIDNDPNIKQGRPPRPRYSDEEDNDEPSSPSEPSSSSSSSSSESNSNQSSEEKDDPISAAVPLAKAVYSEPLTRSGFFDIDVDQAADETAVGRETSRKRLLDDAQKIAIARNMRREHEADEDFGAQSDASNTLSNLGNAAVAVTQQKLAEDLAMRMARAAAGFSWTDFQQAMNTGQPHCYLPASDNCDRCIMWRLANAYLVDPVKIASLLHGVGVAAPMATKPPQQSVLVSPQPALIVPGITERAPEVSEYGRKTKTLLQMYKERNALQVDPNAPFLDRQKYPWRIVGLVSADRRPNLQPITSRPKEKFGPEVNKKIIKHLNANLVPLINSGRLEACHFTVIPDINYSAINEDLRLKAWENVPKYWQKFYDILEADDSIVFAIVNCESHPATKKKGDKEGNQQQNDLEQELEEDRVLNGNDGDADAEQLQEIPNNADEATRRRIEAMNNVKIAARDRKKKAELAEAIAKAIREIDKRLIPLEQKRESGAALTVDELADANKLYKDRKRLEKSRPNILAGFPHFDLFVVRNKQLVPTDENKVGTMYAMLQKLQQTGASDTVYQKIFNKKSAKKDGFEHDLTSQFKYPIIGHNCKTAIKNMEGAGYIVDGKRGMTWMYYNDNDFQSVPWKKNFKNLIVGLQKFDGISLSDEADTWRLDETAEPLNPEEVGEEELLIERIAAYMKKEGLYFYADYKTIIRKKPDSLLSAEVVYENVEDFYRTLTTLPQIKKGLLKRMNTLDEKHLRRYGDLPCMELYFEAIEVSDGFFIMNARPPEKWTQAAIRHQGFIPKGQTFIMTRAGKEQHLTALEVITQMCTDGKLLWFCDMDATMEDLKRPPENWLKAMMRYFPNENEAIANANFARMAQIRKDQAAKRKEIEMIKLTISKQSNKHKAPPAKKQKKGAKAFDDNTPGDDTPAIDLTVMQHAKVQQLQQEVDTLEELYNKTYTWERDQVTAFFEACMRLLFIPPARQKNIFIVGKGGAGKTTALCWLFGHTKKTSVIENVREAHGLYHKMNVATFGGNFSMSSIVEGVTRFCLVQEMTASRAKIADMLTFLEHGQVETEQKFRQRTHGHSGFSKAFTGNNVISIKNDPEVTAAARDRFVHFVMNKTVEEVDRDHSLESKIRLEKFRIVYYLVTRRWDRKLCERLWDAK